MASRTAFVYQDALSIEDAFTYFKRLMRDAENRVAFSRALQRARKGLDVHMYVTDIDSLMIQYLNRGGVKGFRFTGFELKNMNPHSAIVNGSVKVNGKQYEGHFRFSQKAGIDFFYLVNLGREFLVWNVAYAPVSFDWYGHGSAHDYYAFVGLDDVIRVPAQELPGTLRMLLWGRG
ncbi:hypothetical protein [Thermococcus sp.]|uniref:hypothetical protein n=1 Tax=Thermococcus sp. TaxID=35749 RepID=UPI0025CDC383|nr:hypothetical protein [Thermococcus sp.]